MIYLLVLGLIAIGGGLFFVYVNNSKKSKPKKNSDQKITKEGKVIYLFDKDEDGNEKDSNEEDDD